MTPLSGILLNIRADVRETLTKTYLGYCGIYGAENPPEIKPLPSGAVRLTFQRFRGQQTHLYGKTNHITTRP